MAKYKAPMIVTALKGTALRREPHTNLKTKDGEDNVIRSLRKDTYLRSENPWAFVSLTVEGETLTGWVLFDDLGPYETPGTIRKTHSFTFDGKTYQLYQDKLGVAVRQKFLLKDRLEGLTAVVINNDRYYTSQQKIGQMKSRQWFKLE